METCHGLARAAGADPARVLALTGYRPLPQASPDGDPELDELLGGLGALTPEEREPVKEFVRYALAKAAVRR